MRGGYTAAMSELFESTSLCVGRVPIHYHICQVISKASEIAAADLVLLDHYVNDIISYCDLQRQNSYLTHIENLYRILSETGTPVINIFFPIRNMTAPQVEHLERLKELSLRWSLDIVDLNQQPFNEALFSDPHHLLRMASYMFGLRLGDMIRMRADIYRTRKRPACLDTARLPYRVLDLTRDAGLPESSLGSFTNSLISKTYADLGRAAIELNWPSGLSDRSQLISLGYLNEDNIADSAVEVQREAGMFAGFMRQTRFSYRLAMQGYFHEAFREPIEQARCIRLSAPTKAETYLPICGRLKVPHKVMPYTPAKLTELMFHDPAISYEPPRVDRGEALDFTGLASLVFRGFEHVKVQEIMPAKTNGIVNNLRDIAVKLEAVDLEASESLMKLARIFRPQGPFILEKLKEYERLRKKNSLS